MSAKFKESWANLSSVRKKAVVWMGLGLAVIGVAFGAWLLKTPEQPTGQKEKREKKEVTLDKSLLDKSAYLEGKKELSKAAEQIVEMKKQIEAMKAEKKGADKDPGYPAGQPRARETPPLPRPQPYGTGNVAIPPPPLPPLVPGGKETSREEYFGGIEIVSNRAADDKDTAKERDSGKKKTSVYLPPSFMAATLLSGLDAPTTDGAKSHPVPVLLRIKDLAFLPNRVKADLKGCFIIAEGTGNLADERAHLRLVTLSCLSKKGKSVIDQKVKGFCVDSDGSIGIRGEVVSKMGAVIARTVLAGFLAGFGDAIKLQSTTVSVSALGQTQTIDPGKAFQAGAGQGISTASQELAKFYLDLARQSLPVISVQGSRDVTLVVSEGQDLEIKEINLGGQAR